MRRLPVVVFFVFVLLHLYRAADDFLRTALLEFVLNPISPLPLSRPLAHPEGAPEFSWERPHDGELPPSGVPPRALPSRESELNPMLPHRAVQ